jgi:hypothetical protein
MTETKASRKIREMLGREAKLREQIRHVDIDSPRHAAMERTLILAIKARKRLERERK